MNLLEIANSACLQLGLTDAPTVALAKQMARNRDAMIWDQRPWRQAQTICTLAIAAGTTDVELPTGLERTLAARWEGRMLQGMDAGNVLQLMPETFEQQGTPIMFTEQPIDAAGRPHLRLVQVPQQAGTLLVLAKRRCPGLPDDLSQPLIPGEAQALVAFTLGDLWRWQHQFTKAQACYQEASAHLQAMIDTEQTATASAARIIPTESIGNVRLW